MLRNATARRLSKAANTARFVVAEQTDEQGNTVVKVRPARRPARANVNRAAVWASSNGWEI